MQLNFESIIKHQREKHGTNDIAMFKENEKANDSRDKIKLAFFVKQGLDNFLGDIIQELSKKYEVNKIIITEFKQIDDGMAWADICWFEWCDELMIYGSRSGLAETKKIICRLHRFEAFTGYIKSVEWSNVDKIIFVSEHIRDVVIEKIGLDKGKCEVVYNGINLDKFKFSKREKGFNLALVGYLNLRKNPMLVIQYFNELVKIDKRYKLFIAGSLQDEILYYYLNNIISKLKLESNIQFDGFIPNGSINKWFEDKNYIVTGSIAEGHPVGVMEAMASGLKPVIHYFPGSEKFYPNKYIYYDLDDFKKIICVDHYDSNEYSKFIRNNYSLERQIILTDRIIKDLNLNIIKKDFLITIGITNYNAEEYLCQCLDSILSQSYNNIEIIIIDDASQDDSLKILKSYEEKYGNIEIVHHDKNTGSPDFGRSEIIKKSKGDYLMFFDSDDYFQNKYAIEKLIRAACSDKNIDYVYSNLEIVNDKGEKVGRWQYEQYDGNSIVMNTFKRFGSGVLTMKGMFKRKFFENKNITYLSNGTAGDTLTSLLCVKNNIKIKFLNDDIICYRQRQNNLTFDIYKRIKAVVNIEEYIINNFDETIYFPEVNWNEHDEIQRKSTKAYLIGLHYFNMLTMYYKGKWMPWSNAKIVSEEDMLINLNEVKNLIIKYFNESCSISGAFCNEICRILKQVEKIFETVIVVNKDKTMETDVNRS